MANNSLLSPPLCNTPKLALSPLFSVYASHTRTHSPNSEIVSHQYQGQVGDRKKTNADKCRVQYALRQLGWWTEPSGIPVTLNLYPVPLLHAHSHTLTHTHAHAHTRLRLKNYAVIEKLAPHSPNLNPTPTPDLTHKQHKKDHKKTPHHSVPKEDQSLHRPTLPLTTMKTQQSSSTEANDSRKGRDGEK